MLTRQFEAFGDALGDGSPAVRAEAVTGLSSLLDTYWELVPAGVTAGFLQRIAGIKSGTYPYITERPSVQASIFVVVGHALARSCQLPFECQKLHCLIPAMSPR